MRFALGMDNREIARALGPHATGRPRCCIHRAIRQLEGIVKPRRHRRDDRARAGATPPTSRRCLRRALAPVEPPEELASRLERTLVELTELAADELEAWELSAMRDPRNWVRAGGRAWSCGDRPRARRCVLLRARQRQRRRTSHQGVRGLAERTVRDAAGEARKLRAPRLIRRRGRPAVPNGAMACERRERTDRPRLLCSRSPTRS